MDGTSARVRHPEFLVGPLVTLATAVTLLGVAHFFDRIPVRLPECGFKSVLGIPCVGCGGTRSMRALAEGQILAAVRFNPALVFGVLVSAAWAVAAWIRFRRGDEPLPIPEQNRRIRRRALVTALILLLNWIYLILYLP